MKGTQQIGPNTYINTQFSDPPYARGCNYGCVVTSQGIVMIDTPMLPTAAFQWRDELARKGEVRYIINTEYHVDHVGGNYFFPGTIISHQGVREMFTAPIDRVIAYDLGQWALDRGMDLCQYIKWRYEELDPAGLALVPDYKPRPPSVTYSDRLTLYLGSHTFEVIHLPGHTAAQSAVYIPEEKVVFTGDNFAHDCQPSLSQSLPLDWVQSLKKIEALDVGVIVPGHGEAGNKQDLREFGAFIQEAIDRVSGLIKAGKSRDEIISQVSFEGKLPARHAGPVQQRMNVTRLYEVLAGKT